MGIGHLEHIHGGKHDSSFGNHPYNDRVMETLRSWIIVEVGGIDWRSLRWDGVWSWWNSWMCTAGRYEIKPCWRLEQMVVCTYSNHLVQDDSCRKWSFLLGFFAVQIRDWMKPNSFVSQKSAKEAYDPDRIGASPLDCCQQAPITIAFFIWMAIKCRVCLTI